MGILRTILAISVVLSHSYGGGLVGGRLAVQLFYIISGYLISYILIESNSYKKKKYFYINRVLRLFPIYFAVSLLTLGFLIYMEFYPLQSNQDSFVLNSSMSFFNIYGEVGIIGKISLVLSNILIIGQDWIMFTGVFEGGFGFTSNNTTSEVNVWHGLLIPQAWTLGVEISFYALAPFVLKRKKTIIILIILSLMVRTYIIYIGLGFKDPWTYRFFPNELALFLFGSLSHQLWSSILKRKGWIKYNYSLWVTVLLILYCLIFPLLPYKNINTLLLISFFILALPFLFNYQSKNRIDKLIGSLSYPIYISHWFVISITCYILNYFSVPNLKGNILLSIIICIITILFSVMLNRIIDTKINNIRKSLRS